MLIYALSVDGGLRLIAIPPILEIWSRRSNYAYEYMYADNFYRVLIGLY